MFYFEARSSVDVDLNALSLRAEIWCSESMDWDIPEGQHGFERDINCGNSGRVRFQTRFSIKYLKHISDMQTPSLLVPMALSISLNRWRRRWPWVIFCLTCKVQLVQRTVRSSLTEVLGRSNGNQEIYYLQSQNGNLFQCQETTDDPNEICTSEFASLQSDVPKDIEFASEALGKLTILNMLKSLTK